ncbi:MAG: M48 family metalloprotease [Rhodospirillaceae bacterium]|nr:M48 family metalloprotease [Rhodospirillales bacterium]
MSTSRRTILTGLASLGATAALPAWAQLVGAQSDPYAQVDPYADPRNGFPSAAQGGMQGGQRPNRPAQNEMFSSAANDGSAMSEADEIELGRAAYPALIKKKKGAYPDQRLQAALRDFCRPMFAVSDRPHLPWEVTLCNDPSPNAGAFAGGKVLVNMGLLAICDRAGELAATMAHEIGHVDKRHTARRESLTDLIEMLRKNGGMGKGLPLEQLIPNSQGEISDLLDVFMKAYGRDDETEADGHEMVILERLGVAPIHAINDQHNFAKLGGSGLNELASSHPRNEDRMAHIQQLAAMQKRPQNDFVFPGWDVLKKAFPTSPAWRKA